MIITVEETCKLAMKEYDEFVDRREIYRIEKKKRENVDYYKQTIIELKKEEII